MKAVPGTSPVEEWSSRGVLPFRWKLRSAEDRVEYLDKEGYRPLTMIFQCPNLYTLRACCLT